MYCDKCKLSGYSNPPCLKGSGNKKADIMIVNSYASDKDEEKGQAVMSDELIELLRESGIDTKKVYYTNAIKCRSPKGYKFKVSEVKACRNYLYEEVDKVKPKYILLLGSQATQAFDQKITEVNAVVFDINKKIKAVGSYSPSIIYYDIKRAPAVKQAFSVFRNLTKGIENELPKLNIKFITNIREAKKAMDFYEENYNAIAYDIETTGLNRFKDRVNLLGFGNDKVQYILPLEAPYSPLRRQRILQKGLVDYIIKRLNRLKTIAQNGKFDDLFLRFRYKVKPRLDFDIMLASHLLDENTPNGLKENAVMELGAPAWDVNIDLKKGILKSERDYQDYCTYLGYDVYYTYKLYKVFKKRLRSDVSINKIFKHLVMPAARAYEDIETRGVYVYPDRFKKVEEELRGKLADVVEELNEYKEINWSSDKQIADYLYNELELPVIEKTDAGAPSTSESTLKRLSKHHPVIDLILKYRGIAIQISHFVDGWIDRMYEGRLYPVFKLHGTVTGRTSCSNPNLQQVPRDPKIRNLIGAPPGWTLIESDYSQVELRIVALVSGDPTMKRLFQTGEDIHTNTGRAVTGKDDLTKEERKKAKAVNFGFVYGMSWRKFKDYARDSYDVVLNDKEAEQYRKRFFEAYYGLPAWHEKQRKIVRALKQVRNPIGRLRRLPDIDSKDSGKRAEAERQAINSPVQGFGSDLCVLSMVEAHNTFDPNKAYCVGTVHDAQLWVVRNDFVEEFCPRLKKIMESPKALKEVFNFESTVPIVTDVEIGDWGAGKSLEDWIATESVPF